MRSKRPRPHDLDGPVTRAKRRRMCKLFFDLLPDEVCQKIATFVSVASLRPLEDALQLALANEKCRRAVLEAHDYSLHSNFVRRISLTGLLRCDQVFTGELQRLDFHDIDTEHAGRRLLSSPSLLHVRKLTLTPRTLRIVEKLPNLKSLHVILSSGKRGCNQRFFLGLRDRLTALTHLDTLEVQLECECRGRVCVMHRLLQIDGVIVSALSPVVNFPTVTSLDMSRRCSHSDFNWPILEVFPKRREISIRDRHVDAQIPVLQTLERVKIWCTFEADGCVVFASRIGAPVVLLDCEHKVSREEVKKLRACTRLESVAFSSMERGAELELAAIAGSLKTLDISWGIDHQDSSDFYSLEPGTIARIVEHAPLLTGLHLGVSKMPLAEITGILQRMGARLKSFQSCVNGQHETGAERFTSLMECAARYNPSLRSFNFPPWDLEDRRERVSPRAARRLQAALTVLFRHVPLPEAFSLRFKVSSFLRSCTGNGSDSDGEILQL